jgi:hypothetical protein
VLHRHIKAEGKCPATGEEISMDDLVGVQGDFDARGTETRHYQTHNAHAFIVQATRP